MENGNLKEKRERINGIMDNAAKMLEAEGVKYFFGVVDRDARDPDGGKAFVTSDVKGEDMTIILDLALPTYKDLTNLGIWVGQVMQARNARSIKARLKVPGSKVTPKKRKR